MVLIGVSLKINDVEQLFIHLLAKCTSSLENVYLGPLPIFELDYLFIYLLLSPKSFCVVWILSPNQICGVHIFSPLP